MKKITSAFDNASENQLIAFVTALSIFITSWVMYLQHGWITDDSVLYFEVARLFAAGEWKNGYSLYGWPLYPALISAIHKLTSLNIQHAAQLLNVVFFAITTYSFATLIRLAGGDKATIACGALLLFSSTYIVGDVLPMLIRDQGFWAFFLAGLIFLIRFYRNGKISNAIGWQLCAVVAVLFRIEAVTFLIALPFIFITEPRFTKRQKGIKILQASSLTLFIAGLLVITMAISPLLSLGDFGRLGNLLHVSGEIYGQITEGIKSKADLFGEQVLGRFIDDYALTGLILTLVFILLIKCINSVGLIAIAVITFTYKTIDRFIASDVKRILVWLSILALVNASIIITYTFVLSTRYVVILAFVLLIFASFGFSALLPYLNRKSTEHNTKRWVVITLLALLVLSAISNFLPKRAGYNYEQDAVAWVKLHAANADKVFYSSPRERFYAGAAFTSRSYDLWDYTRQAIADGSIHNYDFLVINVEDDLENRTQLLIDQLPDHYPVQEFFSIRNKKKVVIFAKKK